MAQFNKAMNEGVCDNSMSRKNHLHSLKRGILNILIAPTIYSVVPCRNYHSNCRYMTRKICQRLTTQPPLVGTKSQNI